jgi:glutathione S-transferase
MQTAAIPQHATLVRRYSHRTRTRQFKERLLTLNTLDRRSAAYGEAKQLIADLTADLGGDPTAAERQLIQRAAICGVIAGDFETRWIAGDAIPLADYLATCNVQRRELMSLGLERRARPVNGVIRPQHQGGSPMRADLADAEREP